MNIINVILEGDSCWEDLADKIKSDKVIWLREGVISIAALSKGMKSGKPSISIRIELPDGRTLMAETSMRLFLSAAGAFEQRYRKELEESEEEGK